MGLWNSVPGTLLVEGTLFAGALALYCRTFPPKDGKGRWAFLGLVAFTGLIWLSGPWFAASTQRVDSGGGCSGDVDFSNLGGVD